MFRGFCFIFSLSIDSRHQLSPFFNPVYLHLHPVHLNKKPPLCFYPIDYMLPVDFRHKSHFFVDKKCRVAGRDGVRLERLREFLANDAFGRLLRSIIPNDDWHRCNKSRIFKDFISKSRPACSVFRKCLSSVNNKSNFQPIFSPHPFSKAPQINDILTDIFSTSEVRQFDVLKWLGNDPNPKSVPTKNSQI